MQGLVTTGSTTTNQLQVSIPDEWKGMELQITILPVLNKSSKHVKEQQIVLGLPVKFHKNKYIGSFKDFWKLETLFKKEVLIKTLDLFSREITDTFIESIFESSTLKFYTDSKRKHLFANSSPAFISKFGELTIIPTLAALQRYGIDKLEEASEKGYSKI